MSVGRAAWFLCEFRSAWSIHYVRVAWLLGVCSKVFMVGGKFLIRRVWSGWWGGEVELEREGKGCQ